MSDQGGDQCILSVVSALYPAHKISYWYLVIKAIGIIGIFLLIGDIYIYMYSAYVCMVFVLIVAILAVVFVAVAVLC